MATEFQIKELMKKCNCNRDTELSIVEKIAKAYDVVDLEGIYVMLAQFNQIVKSDARPHSMKITFTKEEELQIPELLQKVASVVKK